jgi:hypothetical protein
MENKSKAADKGRQNNGEIDVSTAKEQEREREMAKGPLAH